MQERNPYRIPNDTTTISKKLRVPFARGGFFWLVFLHALFFPIRGHMLLFIFQTSYQ